MLYDLQGTIKALGERIEGTSRNGQPWQKCEVAVEVQDGQYSDTVRQNDTLEAMSVSKNFRLWFKDHCLTAITNDLEK